MRNCILNLSYVVGIAMSIMALILGYSWADSVLTTTVIKMFGFISMFSGVVFTYYFVGKTINNVVK